MRGQTVRGSGYAVVLDGKIDIRTVSPTVRAAKVNAMYLDGIPLYASTTDATIEEMWRAWATRKGAKLEPVLITVEAQRRNLKAPPQ